VLQPYPHGAGRGEYGELAVPLPEIAAIVPPSARGQGTENCGCVFSACRPACWGVTGNIQTIINGPAAADRRRRGRKGAQPSAHQRKPHPAHATQRRAAMRGLQVSPWCPGVHKDYCALFGDEWIKPVRVRPRR